MKDSISHLHIICKDWTRELEFYKTEVPFFKKRLDEVITKNNSPEARAKAEHFENKFKIMDLHFDELLHDVNLKQEFLTSQASQRPNYTHIKVIENDHNLQELMEFTSKDFMSTKKEFYGYLAEYL